MRKKIPLSDRGNYYRGLLVLIRRDRIVDLGEREMMIHLGQSLDFDRRFCEAAIDDVLKNKHIRDVPMTFSDRKTAELFVRDAVLLACVDGEIHSKELTWLKSIAAANGLADDWLNAEMQHLQDCKQPDQSSSAKNKKAVAPRTGRAEAAD